MKPIVQQQSNEWVRRVLLAHARNHQPAPVGDDGLSCDEKGCHICNCGPEDAVDDWMNELVDCPVDFTDVDYIQDLLHIADRYDKEPEPHVCTELMQTDYYEFACAECGEDVVLDEDGNIMLDAVGCPYCAYNGGTVTSHNPVAHAENGDPDSREEEA